LRLVLFAAGELRVKGNYAANVSSDSDYQLQKRTEAKASVLFLLYKTNRTVPTFYG